MTLIAPSSTGTPVHDPVHDSLRLWPDTNCGTLPWAAGPRCWLASRGRDLRQLLQHGDFEQNRADLCAQARPSAVTVSAAQSRQGGCPSAWLS
jgi:hypothetical protein